MPDAISDAAVNVPAQAASKPLIESGAWTPGATIKQEQVKSTDSPHLPSAGSLGIGQIQSLKNEKSGFDANGLADKVNDALHPPFFSTRFSDSDAALKMVMNLSPDDYAAFDKAYSQKFGAGRKGSAEGKPWGLTDDVKAKSGDDDYDRFSRLAESKTHNDVPESERVNGMQLLKAHSELKVGETNVVNMPDGRRYDVYVPKNADMRGPVIVAMHGAAAGDSAGIMEQESGLTAEAERIGAVVVFAYPKVRTFETPIKNVDGVAWNAPDRKNLPSVRDYKTDDRVYLDNVLDDLGKKANVQKQVGLYGFSDGGRFAQVYAADRPDRVAAIVSADGTWMYGDKKPTVAKPIMIVHGTNDETLPYYGGKGSVSNWMDKLLGTNLITSTPYMQAQVWRDANKCEGGYRSMMDKGIESRQYFGCAKAEVKEYIIKDGNHAINDYRNGGSRIVQWALGSPDRKLAFSQEGAAFLRKYIVPDLSAKRQ